jgi:outer membrane lipoprotein-sorting protein
VHCAPLLLASALLLPALLGCPPRKPAEGDPAAVSEVKGLLAERDKKLHAYRIQGTVSEAGHRAAFTFAHRAPNRMLAELRMDTERTFAFDGERLVELVPGEKRAVVFDLAGPPAEVSVELHRIFQSFVPEGFRAPVLELSSARARRVSHPRGPQAVELASEVTDASGLVRAVYVLRWPSMDMLEKRLSHGDSQLRLEVTREHCDERLKLCVPTRIEQQIDGEAGATTELSAVELNAPLPRDAFTPQVPEQWTVERRALLAPEG